MRRSKQIGGWIDTSWNGPRRGGKMAGIEELFKDIFATEAEKRLFAVGTVLKTAQEELVESEIESLRLRHFIQSLHQQRVMLLEAVTKEKAEVSEKGK